MEFVPRDEYVEICRNLLFVNRVLDYTKYLTPTNLAEENKTFMAACRSGTEYNPHYLYQRFDEVDFAGMKGSLENSMDFLATSPLDRIFRRLLVEAANMIDFYHARGDSKNFTLCSIKTFGCPSRPLLNEALSLLAEYKMRRKDTNPPAENSMFAADSLAERMRNELSKYDYHWDVVVMQNLTTKVTVDAEKKTIYINGSKRYSAADMERLIVHEVGTHVIRSENGRHQPYPVFATGLANSMATEEGLAVFMEKKANVLQEETLALYAGRVLGTHLAQSQSFRAVFSALREFLTDEQSLYITQRVKKGIENTQEPGGFTKDFLYLEGLRMISDYASTGGALRILFVGAIGLHDIPDVTALLREKILTEPIVVPIFWDE